MNFNVCHMLLDCMPSNLYVCFELSCMFANMLVFSVSFQDMCDLLKRHIVLIRELHGALIPKHHLMVHLVFLGVAWQPGVLCNMVG